MKSKFPSSTWYRRKLEMINLNSIIKTCQQQNCVGLTVFISTVHSYKNFDFEIRQTQRIFVRLSLNCTWLLQAFFSQRNSSQQNTTLKTHVLSSVCRNYNGIWQGTGKENQLYARLSTELYRHTENACEFVNFVELTTEFDRTHAISSILYESKLIPDLAHPFYSSSIRGTHQVMYYRIQTHCKHLMFPWWKCFVLVWHQKKMVFFIFSLKFWQYEGAVQVRYLWELTGKDLTKQH